MLVLVGTELLGAGYESGTRSELCSFWWFREQEKVRRSLNGVSTQDGWKRLLASRGMCPPYAGEKRHAGYVTLQLADAAFREDCSAQIVASIERLPMMIGRSW